MPYYAVAKGRSAGVYNSWGDCKDNVSGYSGATYKKFDTQSEAQSFVSQRSEGGSSSRSSGGGSYGGSSYSGGGYSSYGGGYSGSGSGGNSSAKAEKIYVDGAARGNGRNDCPQSGYGVYYGAGDSRNSAVPLSAVDNVSQVKPTNQRAELHAVKHALNDIQNEHASNPNSSKSYEIHTDSTYTKNSIDNWANNWKNNDWKTSSGSNVANRDLIEPTHGLYNNLKDSGVPVELVHVKGHSNNEGNDQADRLANQGADQMR
ncbi:hypothetical protein JCM33374_g6442 [Metschnikowia sp. JCM 33374]|nr:hypothetical protein JCM33374_g6442 [Metschnikowia sp. JCM 33374]